MVGIGFNLMGFDVMNSAGLAAGFAPFVPPSPFEVETTGSFGEDSRTDGPDRPCAGAAVRMPLYSGGVGGQH